jgi:hypothetical protein
MGLQPGYDAFRAAALDRRAEVATTMLARRTQTNEPARCATLLPALASLRQPLAVLEVGASAGLCLLPDRYGYGLQVSWTRHLARKPFVIKGYGMAGEPPLGRV